MRISTRTVKYALLTASLLFLPALALGSFCGPGALAVSHDGKRLFVAAEGTRQIVCYDTIAETELWRRTLPSVPTGIAQSAEGALYVTYAGATNVVVAIHPVSGTVVRSYPVATTPGAPLLSRDCRTLYVCGRYASQVSRIDLTSGRVLTQSLTGREPLTAALHATRSCLAIGHLLPARPANQEPVATAIDFLDSGSLRLKATALLPNGSTALRSVAFHPKEPTLAAVHMIARHQVPTTQVEHGWMHVAALSLLSATGELRATVFLDEARAGAADPSAVIWLSDQDLAVLHAGTHEVSLIEWRKLEQRLAGRAPGSLITSFDILEGIRRRVKLSGQGPRFGVAYGERLFCSEYFSGAVSVLDWRAGVLSSPFFVGEGSEGDLVREGERLFHDARMAHQSWHSCASCHPDGREDGLNWDLLNDGIGNPKNTKSLLWAMQTPPAMSTGVRESGEKAIHSGLRHILFSIRPAPDAEALKAYISSLTPLRSPSMTDAIRTGAFERGRTLFDDSKVGCSTCHPPPLFTDQQRHRVYLSNTNHFDTPTLIECWRTAPYLHDGSAGSLIDVLTKRNSADRHGTTSHLNPAQVEDLAAYVSSL